MPLWVGVDSSWDGYAMFGLAACANCGRPAPFDVRWRKRALRVGLFRMKDVGSWSSGEHLLTCRQCMHGTPVVSQTDALQQFDAMQLKLWDLWWQEMRTQMPEATAKRELHRIVRETTLSGFRDSLGLPLLTSKEGADIRAKLAARVDAFLQSRDAQAGRS